MRGTTTKREYKEHFIVNRRGRHRRACDSHCWWAGRRWTPPQYVDCERCKRTEEYRLAVEMETIR